MITKKVLKMQISELFERTSDHSNTLFRLNQQVNNLKMQIEKLADMESPTKSQLRAKKVMKIKVKGTPGRPKKIEVKVKRGPGRPKKNAQPRTKDGKFTKKK